MQIRNRLEKFILLRHNATSHFRKLSRKNFLILFYNVAKDFEDLIEIFGNMVERLFVYQFLARQIRRMKLMRLQSRLIDFRYAPITIFTYQENQNCLLVTAKCDHAPLRQSQA